MMHTITLLKNKERSVELKHPWIFSGAISHYDKELPEGSLVQVRNSEGRFLATGYFNRGSIAVRILSFDERAPDLNFWKEKIRTAYQYRQSLGFLNSQEEKAFRLFNAEGDGIPGLVIDFYAGYCVVQSHSIYIASQINEIAEALQLVLTDDLRGIYHAQNTGESEQSDFPGRSDQPETIITENNLKFLVNWKEGQKTGFFLDQQENRALVGKFSSGKKVLNCFAYSGGFSVHALQGGATSVESVDSSEKASVWAHENVRMNFENANHKFHCMEVIPFLQKCPEQYNLIVLDPPAYAKRRSALKKAEQGYRRLHQLSFPLLDTGGLLFTYSCSQAVDMSLFKKLVFQAASESKRDIKIVKQLHQSPDHPVSIYHPEGEYLKGLMLYVS